MLILSKIHHFRFFNFFSPNQVISILKTTQSTKFDTGFRLVHKLSLLNKLFFFLFFWFGSHPMQKIDQNFWVLGNWRTIVRGQRLSAANFRNCPVVRGIHGQFLKKKLNF
jgi:hypothetical protein